MNSIFSQLHSAKNKEDCRSILKVYKFYSFDDRPDMFSHDELIEGNEQPFLTISAACTVLLEMELSSIGETIHKNQAAQLILSHVVDLCGN